MSIWRRALSLVVACVLPLVPARAEDKPPMAATLDLNPVTVAGRAVTDGEPVFFQVRLKAGSQELKDITLSAFSNDGIEATPDPSTAAVVPALAATAEQVWKLKVTPANPNVVPVGALTVNVSVGFKEGKDTPLQRHLFQALSITAPGAVTVPTLAEIDFKGSTEPLSYQRPGRLFITVTNKYSQGLEVTDIKISTPRFITAAVAPTRLQIPYGEAGVVAVDVIVAKQIVPGKYPIVVVASLKTANGLSGSVVKSQEIDIGVLGESDLLSKIGAPSMLFLPGVLFLLAWQLLWSIGKTAAERTAYSLPPTVGGFWVVAVAIAFIVARLYPTIALAVTGEPRDYLVAYGFDDYAYLFALVIGSAAAFYLAWLGLLWLYGWYKAIRLRYNTPTGRDLPIHVLNKLGRLGLTVDLPRAHPSAGPAGNIVYVLDAWREETLIWIVPPALLDDGPQADANSRNLLQEIGAGRIREARRLARLLQDGLDAGWWTLIWRPVAGVDVPRKVPAASWTEVVPTARFIRI